MSDITQASLLTPMAGRRVEAFRYAWLTLAFFTLVFGGLAGVLVVAHHVAALVA